MKCVKYCWASNSGDSFSGEHKIVFDDETEYEEWLSALRPDARDRFYVVCDIDNPDDE